ncbi:hypothetical protein FHR84_002137 [Actinopolyspora biskrensis]|uniref:Uncharacterized protein n=1 Tax=Actinopolyspora biskrensis TaxID=1470178 RepID=A0A852YYL0_9ACTN|nr:hypothetical protein [Actinopolyspora biskrensis]NYH78812.1 hypothetical protein [Actinopolyspora biskrensis]
MPQGEQYSMTFLHNDPDLANTTFAAFAKPIYDIQNPFGIAWFSHSLNYSHWVTFYWELDWGYAYSEHGFSQGKKWVSGGYQYADPQDKATCSMNFYYSNGDFDWESDYVHPPSPDRDKLWVTFDPSVEDHPATHGLCLSTSSAESNQRDEFQLIPIIAGDVQARMIQNFTLDPTYFVTVGSYKQGQMASMSEILPLQQVQYAEGVKDMTAELVKGNTWKVYPSQ